MRILLSSQAIAVIAVVGATSACAGTPMTYNQIAPPNAQSVIAYGAAGRDLKVDVVGNPFPQPAEEVGKALALQMNAAAVGPGTHFTTQPGPSAMKDFRVVVSFDGAASTAGNVVVEASLYDGDKLLTRTDGRTDGVTRVDDPAVADLMKHVALELFPAQADWKN